MNMVNLHKKDYFSVDSLSLHMFKYSFVKKCVDSDVDYRIIMKLLGHKLDKVNDRYIHIDMTKLQKSREKVNLSYKKMKKNL
ncbi:MAG: hypothetical protein HFF37_04030 [Coprobacillus sp.]|jgi:site-specific recombinase XerD|nr:hypothetical protein [Coprobacillus sp.]